MEVRKLLELGFIKKVCYSKFLTNVLMVRKTSTKWRMYRDYIDLNKVCLPHLNRTVDMAASHELLSFIDAFFGYNQIKMCREDEEKTSFIIE